MDYCSMNSGYHRAVQDCPGRHCLDSHVFLNKKHFFSAFFCIEIPIAFLINLEKLVLEKQASSRKPPLSPTTNKFHFPRQNNKSTKGLLNQKRKKEKKKVNSPPHLLICFFISSSNLSIASLLSLLIFSKLLKMLCCSSVREPKNFPVERGTTTIAISLASAASKPQ